MEEGTLLLRDKAGRGHRNVGLMYIAQIRLAWRNDLRTGNAPVKASLHHGTSSEDANPLKTALFDRSTHLNDQVHNRELGYGFEIVDTEMAGNRGDGNRFGSSRDKPVCKPVIDDRLGSGIILGKIGQERWRIGMCNGQLERRIFPGKRRNQSPIVKIRCCRADPANKADVHSINLAAIILSCVAAGWKASLHACS